MWQLSKEVVAELKEVFMLFDKDEDGVLSFPELEVVMKNLGQVPTETELLRMVREVRRVPVLRKGSRSNFLFPR